MKRCSACKTEKEASCFHKNKRHSTGLSRLCKACYSEHHKAYYARPDKREKRRKAVQAYQARPGFKEERRLYDLAYRLRTVERRKQWRAAGKERERERMFQQQYGITISDYDKMFEDQSGLCAICSNPPKNVRLAVDHCHSTGKIRGLLCTRCNHGIGHLGDDPKIMLAAAEYVTKHQTLTDGCRFVPTQ